MGHPQGKAPSDSMVLQQHAATSRRHRSPALSGPPETYLSKKSGFSSRTTPPGKGMIRSRFNRVFFSGKPVRIDHEVLLFWVKNKVTCNTDLTCSRKYHAQASTEDNSFYIVLKFYSNNHVQQCPLHIVFVQPNLMHECVVIPGFATLLSRIISVVSQCHIIHQAMTGAHNRLRCLTSGFF